MRNLLAIVILSLPAFAVAQTQPTLNAVEQQLIGSWKSPDLGLDFPIWMVDTYAVDGTVLTNFYSKPRDKEILSKDKINDHWRLRNATLEVGKMDKDGTFKVEGRPRPIRLDAAGKIQSIGGWVRLPTATSKPTGGG